MSLETQSVSGTGTPGAQQTQSEIDDLRARLTTAETERRRAICSACGTDHDGEPDGSSDCCSCDVMPATALPGLLKSTRAEADENERLAISNAYAAKDADDRARAAEARVEAAEQRALENAYAAKDTTDRVEALSEALRFIVEYPNGVGDRAPHVIARTALACPPQQPQKAGE